MAARASCRVPPSFAYSDPATPPLLSQASGIGAHLALPLLRKAWKADLTEGEARKLLEDCMRVLFYRDTRASPNITIGKADATGASISEPFTLDSYWEFPAFARGNTVGDGSW